MTIYWIDDDGGRVNKSKTIFPKGRKYCVELLKVEKDQSLLPLIEKWLALNKPSLVIVDHKFNLATSDRLNGSTCAHILRRRWQDVPFVCVTAQVDGSRPRKKEFDEEDISEYVDVIPFAKLKDRLPELLGIAADFPALAKIHAKGMPALAEHLGVPAADRDIFARSLPNEFHATSLDSTPHRLARWVVTTLMDQPGFLYDKLHVATMLGLKERSFDRVSEAFAAALYRGPFAAESRPRWWRSLVRKLLNEVVGDNAPFESWLAGRQLPSITPKDYSICFVEGNSKAGPDTVAYTMPDETPRQVCSRYTEVVPSLSSNTVGLEPIRQIVE